METHCFIFGALLSFAVIVQCQSESSGVPSIDECASELGVSMDTMNAPDAGTNPQVKCVLACSLTKEQVMIDGKIKIDEDKVTSDNPEKFLECVDLANQESDECERALYYFKNCIQVPALNQ